MNDDTVSVNSDSSSSSDMYLNGLWESQSYGDGVLQRSDLWTWMDRKTVIPAHAFVPMD